MINRKEIKNRARNNLKHHYFRNVLVTFIVATVLAGGFSYTSKNLLEVPVLDNTKIEIIDSRLSNSEIVRELIVRNDTPKKYEEKLKSKYKYGVISYLINETTQKGSFMFTILNGINKMLMKNKISVGLIIILSSILLVVFNLVFLNVLVIGKNRYFLEERKYRGTKIERILYPYKTKKMRHLAYILFLKSLYQLLWSLTIIGGIVKHYEYLFIPYVLSENPKLSKKEAFLTAKKLVDGYKWDLFKMDLSLLGWNILNVCTMNISGIFYSNVYKETIYAEVYMVLRKNKNLDVLNDNLLDIEEEITGCYPEIKKNKWFNINYNKDYDIQTYVLFFFTFSVIGWIWEVLLQFLKYGILVNRGTMFGPWLPIYGWGGVLILILLKKFRAQPAKLFVLAFLLCGIIEYATSWYLEYFKHLRYWDYSGYFLNINGRVCLEGLILFGLGGCAFTYFVAPLLDNLYKKINPKVALVLCIVLISLYNVDLIYSSHHPNMGERVSREVKR